MAGDEQIEIVSYRDLKVWQLAMDIAEQAYTFTREFPRSETYGMASQIRRAATSIAANIAEGNGRETSGAYVQALRTSQGSLKELETHILIATRVGLSTGSNAEPILMQCDELGRMLRALIRSIQRNAAAAE